MNTLQEKLFKLLEIELIIDKKDMFKYKTYQSYTTNELLKLLNDDLYTDFIIENNTYLVSPSTGNKITIGKAHMNIAILEEMDFTNNIDCVDCEFIEDCQNCTECYSIRNGVNVLGASHFVF